MKNELTVVKFGGSIAADKTAREGFLRDFAALAKRQPAVLVHGGGPEIKSWMERLSLPGRFIKGLRYTDEATLEIVTMVLCGKLNKALAAALCALGLPAAGIAGTDAAMARCRKLRGLGLVGEPHRIDARLIKLLLAGGITPVLSTIGTGPGGKALNVNADSMAMAIAAVLKASRLILFTDVPGVLDARGKTIARLTTREIPKLQQAKVITGGMIPKLAACAGALRAGVREVVIADGRSGMARLTGTIITK